MSPGWKSLSLRSSSGTNGDGDHDSAEFAAETLKQHRDRSIQILIKRSLLLEKTILKKLARFSLSFKPVWQKNHIFEWKKVNFNFYKNIKDMQLVDLKSESLKLTFWWFLLNFDIKCSLRPDLIWFLIFSISISWNFKRPFDHFLLFKPICHSLSH